MLAFSTPFDETAVDFLESLDVPAYKIASFENTDLPLIRRVAATGKPLIISTGMASVAELDESVRTARAAGCKDLILLKCTSTYPASPENSHVRTIPHLRELFGCQVGLSDHSMGVGVAVAAVALGATVVEKHFTLDRADGGVDSSFSLEPAELASLVVETERAWQALGQVHYGVTEAERKSLCIAARCTSPAIWPRGKPSVPTTCGRSAPASDWRPGISTPYSGALPRQALKRGTALAWSLVE